MVGYKGIHKWLIINFGKANKCENPECSCKEPEKFEWSLINGMEYERKRDNFWMLCTSCHKTYDGIINNIKKMNNYEKITYAAFSSNPVSRAERYTPTIYFTAAHITIRTLPF